ncbi:hypothetical protein HMPREF1210_02083 [Paenisporosarcina sp. HGH0030]|uniref:alpha/beta family hydrolase n=1 Tax=Paenisporosarcina sp. HGH0030 TaxID=1078085 RepID=UPI00034E2559|nr:alpha/beta family hydrolase [Paenisporosarcina sp. HGH0030]EPD51485.1 hypothetical protein HMPREF1210_02083 [Paenisporosarcina sp. HGH0030]
MKNSSSIVKGYKEMNIPYTLLSNQNHSKNLVVFLPGTGYTVQSPLFHYVKDLFSQRDFDVLQINYQYKDKSYTEFTKEEIIEAIKFDVNTVIDEVLKNDSYENSFIMGKSLGTIAMNSVLNRMEFMEAKAIWLTPLIQLDEVFSAMAASNHNGLCFIGDGDECYIKERYDVLKNNPNIVSRLIPNVNHSLEYDNYSVESIDVMKSVVVDIQNFVQQNV